MLLETDIYKLIFPSKDFSGLYELLIDAMKKHCNTFEEIEEVLTDGPVIIKPIYSLKFDEFTFIEFDNIEIINHNYSIHHFDLDQGIIYLDLISKPITH